MGTALHLSEHNQNSEPPPPSPFSAPRTSFNLAITPHRRVRFGEVALEDLKAIKNHFGCTVNDVVLALCAGALRRYLLRGGASHRSAGWLRAGLVPRRGGKAERRESSLCPADIAHDPHR